MATAGILEGTNMRRRESDGRVVDTAGRVYDRAGDVVISKADHDVVMKMSAFEAMQELFFRLPVLSTLIGTHRERLGFWGAGLVGAYNFLNRSEEGVDPFSNAVSSAVPALIGGAISSALFHWRWVDGKRATGKVAVK